MKYLSFLFIVAALMFAGCAGSSDSMKYVIHYSKPVRIKKANPVLVVSNNELLKLAVENVLVDRDFYVKDFDSFKKHFTTLIGEYKINAKEETHVDNYNIMKTLNDMLQKSGQLEVSPEFFKGVKNWNDIKDEGVRVGDYKKVEFEKFEAIHELYKKLGVEYLIVVEQLESKKSFKFSAKLVSTADDKVLFTLLYEADANTLENTQYQQYKNSQISGDSKLQGQTVYLRFADYLAQRMFGGVGI